MLDLIKNLSQKTLYRIYDLCLGNFVFKYILYISESFSKRFILEKLFRKVYHRKII